MVNMPQIIASCITGLFVFIALMVQHILLSRRKKIEDVASAIIPRRAELYRELIQKICRTGIQYKYENDNASKVAKIAFLHEICNRAIYELCPFASINVTNAIMKLSEICAKHRPIITESDDKEISEKWDKFKGEFQFHFLHFATLARLDCLSDPINKIVEDKRTREYVNMFYPKKDILIKKGKK
jgi:hypothetical protein